MKNEKAIALEPCPFCGGEVGVEIAEQHGCKTEYDIYCYGENCFRPINNFPFESEQDAIKAWNLRVALLTEKPCETCGGSKREREKSVNTESYIWVDCPDCPPKENVAEFVKRIREADIRNYAYSGNWLIDNLCTALDIIESMEAK